MTLLIKERNSNALERSKYIKIKKLKEEKEKMQKKLEKQKRIIKNKEDQKSKEKEAYKEHCDIVRNRKKAQDFIYSITQREFYETKHEYIDEINKLKNNNFKK